VTKAFTETEKEYIQSALLKAGRRLFVTTGVKKTSLQDLTQAAQIAKSTFYLFYESKEALFLAIFLEEAQKVLPQILVVPFENSEDPKACIQLFFKNTLTVMQTNPLIRRFLEKEDLELILRRVSPEQLLDKRDRSVEVLAGHISAWQAAGKVIPGPAKIMAGAVRALVFLVYHTEEIGEDVFDSVMDLLIERLAESLLVKGEIP
jgi:AcrR family transcriptional regulator